MRILFIISQLKKGGAQSLLFDIYRELQKKNITAKIILLKNENDYDGLINDIKIDLVPSEISLSIFKRPKINIDNLWIEINNYKPDVIHSHLFEAEIVSRSCFFPQAKWISHCHDNMEQFNNFTLQTLFKKKLFANYYEKKYLFKQYKKNGGTHFIAISKDTEQYFKQSAKPYQVTLLHNAIKYSMFYKPKNYNKNKPKVSLINIGSFVNKKNQSFLITVASILKKRHIDFELHLLGDGVNKSKIIEKVSCLNLEKEVLIHGNVNNIEEYLWQSDIYVHSALYEPFGLVLLEAMASGLPVVTLDGKGNRDLIENNKNGFIIYKQSAELFADKIIELIENKELYQSMSNYAVEFAKKYDIKEYVDNLLNIYKKVLSE